MYCNFGLIKNKGRPKEPSSVKLKKTIYVILRSQDSIRLSRKTKMNFRREIGSLAPKEILKLMVSRMARFQ